MRSFHVCSLCKAVVFHWQGPLDHSKNRENQKLFFLKDSFKILVYFAGVVLLGALLAPWLFWAGNWLGHQHSALQILNESDFQRYFHRAILIAAVVLLLPICRWLHLPGLKALFAQNDSTPIRHLVIGFILALGVMTALAFSLIHFDYWNWKTPLPWHRVQKVLLTALVVPIIEELFFRGALTKLITRSSNRWWALIFVSALYSIVHFLKPRDTVISDSAVNWLSGFHLIPLSFERFSEPQLLLYGWGTLFILGLTLGYAAMKTRGLWFSIGLHAGVILGKFSFTKLAKFDSKKTIMPWLNTDLTIGIVALGVMALLFILVWLTLRKNTAR